MPWFNVFVSTAKAVGGTLSTIKQVEAGNEKNAISIAVSIVKAAAPVAAKVFATKVTPR